MNVRPMTAADAGAVLAIYQAAGIWTVQSAIFPENTASTALHAAAGFRCIGVREKVGRHPAQANRWRDTVLIERRSPTVL